jgi:molybdopterin/thiamine biosynthesis adenylyltransferase
MSGSRLVRNSTDLQRLVNDGYTVRIVNGYLVIDDIPYVDATREVQWGSFLCPLDVAGEQTTKPSNHVMAFVGSAPCSKDGGEISPGFANPGLTYNWTVSPELTPSIGFSQKPRPDGYTDFYEKVTTYAAILIGPAQAIDPDVTPLQGKPFITDEGDGVFVYLDTFSSRAGITARSKRLEVAKVVIVGLGGTGAYILDLLAKTPICNIHLYDGDVFSTHNAFRAPGAATLDALSARMRKVDYYATTYSAMRRQIHPHPVNVTEANVSELLDAKFVFLAMDSGPDKQFIISALVAAGIAFIDTGVGVSDDPNGLAGQVRVTTALPDASEHVVRGGLISIVAGDAAEYDTNLQVAELNMAAAVMAVIRFKKWLDFYADSEGELHSSYRIDTNEILNKYERTAEATDVSSDGAA